jgi:hypothetical protein
MSNNYTSYYTLHPSSYQNYVYSQVLGPLNTSQTPGQIEYHNNGILNGVTPNPPKFYPSDNSSEFSQSRKQYIYSTQKQQLLAREKEISRNKPYSFFSMSTQKQYPTETGHMNYISPICSSMRTSILKRNSVGQSSYKQGLPIEAELSYKKCDVNLVKTRLQRARSAGCVPPAKVGSIFNKTCRIGGGICNSGSIVGQGY